MKKIGILFGVENSFPSALVEQINARNIDGIQAEFVLTGAAQIDRPPRYAVIVDRISHAVPFYRAFLKHAALHGTAVINNPFWASADDKFFNYTLAKKLGVAVPPTVILPHKQLPEGATDRSMRNLEFPLDWEAVFAYAGEDGFLKPIDGGGWRDVHRVHNRDEFFRAYDQSRDLCMVYQKAVDFSEYFRCYVVGGKKVRIMAYDPRRPHSERYAENPAPAARGLVKRMRQDALKLCARSGLRLQHRRVCRREGHSLRHRLHEPRAGRRHALGGPGQLRLDRQGGRGTGDRQGQGRDTSCRVALAGVFGRRALRKNCEEESRCKE